VMVSILLLEDSAVDADLIAEHLNRGGIDHQIMRVTGRHDYFAALTTESFDVILADHSLPAFDGFAALEMARTYEPEVPFIFVSATLGEEVAIQSLQLGATDYVLKQRLQRLVPAIRRALDEARERKERRRAELRQRLLVDELSHRVKNTLATVQSIAQQTLRRSSSLPEFERAFLGRLRALADTHALLLRSNWHGAELRALIEQALRPFRGPALAGIALEGPPVRLEPREAMSLSMVLHELATNAAKHGALSSPDGAVDVCWRLSPDSDRYYLALSWTERGGPPARAPERAGFGTVLITRSVRHELDGVARLSYPEAGAVCELTFPLLAGEGAPPPRPSGRASSPPPATLST
jgi:two-component sensor histidine kinase/CheY-like chemotaxis protein